MENGVKAGTGKGLVKSYSRRSSQLVAVDPQALPTTGDRRQGPRRHEPALVPEAIAESSRARDGSSESDDDLLHSSNTKDDMGDNGEKDGTSGMAPTILRNLYFLDAKAFQQVSCYDNACYRELLSNLSVVAQVRSDMLNLTADFQDLKRAHTMAFDLDAAVLLVKLTLIVHSVSLTNPILQDYFLVAPPGNDCSNNAGGDGTNTSSGSSCPLDLKDPKLFQGANFPALRVLRSQLRATSAHYMQVLRCLGVSHTALGSRSAQVDAIAHAQSTLYANCRVELHFHAFWATLLLRAIPAQLQVFRDYGMVALDVQTLFAHLLTSYRMPQNAVTLSDQRADDDMEKESVEESRGDDNQFFPAVTTWESLTQQHIERMSFEQFLAFLNAHSAQSGKSLTNAFYADFVAGMSPLLVDYLKQHGALLEGWRF